MNPETPYFLYVILLYAIFEIGASVYGTIKAVQTIKKDPFLNQTHTEIADMEKARPIIVNIVNEYYISPFSRRFMRNYMNEYIDKCIKDKQNSP